MVSFSYKPVHQLVVTLVLVLSCICFIQACKNKSDEDTIHYPSEQYEYISIDTVNNLNSMIYVPIYSHLYMWNGTRPANFAATLSIRSMDFSDSVFVSKVDYYNSKGGLVKKYLDRILLLKPMHSAEFIVEEKNVEGGAGAHFIVSWFAKRPVNEPLIQAIMLSTANSLGFSFKTEGVKLNKQ